MPAWWKMSLMALLISIVPLVFATTGCSGGGGGLLSIDEKSEIDIGQQAAADLEHQYGVVNDSVQTPRIQRIGRVIAASSPRPNLPWSFRILNSNDINALSLPGGPVYVTRGLINMGLSDAELAGVIGHEEAHIVERHSVKAIQRGMTYSLLSQLVLGRSSRAVQTAANLAIQYALELPHSRADEYQADDVGMRLAYNVGYNPQGMVAFLQRLQQVAGRSGMPAWMSTHPLTSDRIVRAQREATQLASTPRPVPITFRDGLEAIPAKNKVVEKTVTLLKP